MGRADQRGITRSTNQVVLFLRSYDSGKEPYERFLLAALHSEVPMTSTQIPQKFEIGDQNNGKMARNKEL